MKEEKERSHEEVHDGFFSSYKLRRTSGERPDLIFLGPGGVWVITVAVALSIVRCQVAAAVTAAVTAATAIQFGISK